MFIPNVKEHKTGLFSGLLVGVIIDFLSLNQTIPLLAHVFGNSLLGMFTIACLVIILCCYMGLLLDYYLTPTENKKNITIEADVATNAENTRSTHETANPTPFWTPYVPSAWVGGYPFTPGTDTTVDRTKLKPRRLSFGGDFDDDSGEFSESEFPEIQYQKN